MKLKIKNFQSIEDGLLEFPVGISIIVGSSNSGKTGCVRAIYSVLKNPSEAKAFIKHRTNKTEVSLSTEDVKVTWTRTLKDSTYEVGGEVLQKVGKTDLISLQNTGFYEDVSGDIINIQDEWTMLFPFNRTDSEVYKLFEDVFAINDSSTILKKIKEDELNIRKELAKCKEDIEKYSNNLNRIESFISEYEENVFIDMRNNLTNLLNEERELDYSVSRVMTDLQTISNISKLNKVDIDLSEVFWYNNLIKDLESLDSSLTLINSELQKPDICLEEVYGYLSLNQDALNLITVLSFINVCMLENISLSFEDSLKYLELDNDCVCLANSLSEISKIQSELKQIESEKEHVIKLLNSVEICPLCGQETNGGIGNGY